MYVINSINFIFEFKSRTIRMNYKNLFFSFFILCFGLSLFAQKTEIYHQPQNEYQKAISLFDNGAYVSAQDKFDDLQQSH